MKRFAILALVLATALFTATGAMAAGTAAGTIIQNTATANFQIGTVNLSESASVTFTVSEVVNITVAWADAGAVQVEPGDTDEELNFTVTNTGNGTEDFYIDETTVLGAVNDFDPTQRTIWLDRAGNLLEEITELTEAFSLDADEVVTITVRNDIPNTALDGQTGDARIYVYSGTFGTGTTAAGSVSAGNGTGGTDAVLGYDGGTDNKDMDQGTYVVSSLEITIEKDASVEDIYGNVHTSTLPDAAEGIPGSTVTYSIKVWATGGGIASNMVVTDTVPAGVTYVANSCVLNAVAPLTDAADGDPCTVAGGVITVNLYEVTNGDFGQAWDLEDFEQGDGTQTITFQATID